MKTVLSFLIKSTNALLCLGFLSLTVWSFVTNQPAIATLVALAIAGVMGFFAYFDIKQHFFDKK